MQVYKVTGVNYNSGKEEIAIEVFMADSLPSAFDEFQRRYPQFQIVENILR